MPWRRKWHPTPVLLPGKSHGPRSLVGYGPWDHKESDMTERLHFTLHFFCITGWGIDLDYCDIEWFALETNRDHSVIFEIASRYCISDSFVDYEGYSISSKGFLPTVIDIMVISVKFTHSSPF